MIGPEYFVFAGGASDLSASGPGVLVQLVNAGAVSDLVGTNGQVLTWLAGVPTFASPSAGTITIGQVITSSTNYDILSIDGAGNLSEISPSTAGDILMSNGVSAAATFQAQTQITQLGTITTGVWEGTSIGSQWGGTGGNSSSSSGIPHVASGVWSYSEIVSADITNNNVTYGKIQQASASTLLGNPTGSTANVEEITLGTNLSFSGSVLNATGGGSSYTGDGTTIHISGGNVINVISGVYDAYGSASTAQTNAEAASQPVNTNLTSIAGLANAAGALTNNGSGGFSYVGYAPLASPTFTGVPAAPTATSGTNTTQLATTAFVTAAVSAGGGATGANPTALIELTAVNGSAATFMRSDGAPALDQSIAPTWTGIHNWGGGAVVIYPSGLITAAEIAGAVLNNCTGMVIANRFDNSLIVASDQFVQNALEWSMGTVVLNLASTAGYGSPVAAAMSTYSFASKGSGLSLTAVMTGGVITSVSAILGGGSGYVTGDLVIVTGGNYDSILAVHVTAGAIDAIAILNGGTGYGIGPSSGPTQPAVSCAATYLLSGALTTGNKTLLMTPGVYFTQSNQWQIGNQTTGAFTMTVKLSGQSGGISTDTPTGTGVLIPQTAANTPKYLIETDGVTDVWPCTVTALPASSLTGTTLPSSITVSSLTSFGSGIALGTPASGNLANCTFPTLNQNTTGSAGSCTGNAATVTTNANLTGPITSVGNATSIAANAVTSAKVDSSVIIASGANAFTGPQSMGSNQLNNLATGTAGTDAVNLTQLNAAIALATSELGPKNDCQAATTAALAAATYNNVATPPSGVGATLTLTVAAVLILDGYTPLLGDRILVKNQASAFQNGLYTVTTLGTALVNAVLTRTLDFDQPADGINGALVYILNGTTNGNTLWSCTTNASVNFGTTNINWSKFLGSTYSADGTTITLTGTTFSLTNSSVTVNGTSIALGATGTVTAAAGTLTGATLAAGVTGSSLTSFGNSPTFVTPVLGTPTSGNFSTGTFTWPTFNQNTTGTAANITGIAAIVNGGTGQTTSYAAKDALTVKSTDIPSAATTDLSTATGEYVHITGTTTITALGPCAAGVVRVVRFMGILTLTHNGTSLILPNAGSNVVTAVGDEAEFRSEGSGNWYCSNYTRANGTSLAGAGTGTVTTVSVVSANGFAGTVANPTTTPAITLTTMPPMPGFMAGFGLAWVSGTVITVGPTIGTSQCADSTNLVTISLSTQGNVTITSNGAINGNDSFAGAGTCGTGGSSSVTLAGVSTTWLTSFAPNGAPRAGDGTISSSAAVVTGVGTAFMNGPHKLALGDLIGNTTSGYFQVIAIASDTVCTIVGTPGTPFSASAWNVIENPTIQATGGNVIQVTKIASNTSLTMEAAQTITAGTAYTIGVVPKASSMPASAQGFMYVWVGVGSSGTGCFVSTQRTTPFGITNYNANFRRVGYLFISAGAVVAFDQAGDDRNRTYTYEDTQNADGTRVLSAGTVTSAWTTVVCSGCVPPTAVSINLNFIVATELNGAAFLRRRGTGSTALTRNTFVLCTDASGSSAFVPNFPIDGAQCFDYVSNLASMQVTCSVVGVNEVL